MKKVFLLGNPRSGTSLLRLMLNAHPEIIAPPECGFLHWWSQKYFDWKWENASEELIAEFITDVCTSKKIETWNLNVQLLHKNILKFKPNSYAHLGQIVFETYAQQTGKMPLAIVDKNNYYIHHLEELKAIWPDARYIHLIRDGRDVACSYKDIEKLDTNSPYKPKLSTDINAIAEEWTRNNQNILSFMEGLNRKEDYISVRFEDVVGKSKEALKRLCDFLDLEFSPAMLTYYNSEFYDEPKETLDWKKKTQSEPDNSSVGRYKALLDEEEISNFNSLSKSILNKFNYSF